jgi:hypothetical protein
VWQPAQLPEREELSTRCEKQWGPDSPSPVDALASGRAYLPGERLMHATFGVGVVASVPGPGKVEVHFPGGVRTLACAKTDAKLERPVAVESLTVPDSPDPKSGPHRP